MATLAAPGDAVILPTPWYFNHAMWLSMTGVEAVPLPTGGDLLPDPRCRRPDHAAHPGDCAGHAQQPGRGGIPRRRCWPPSRRWPQRHKIALILDETYRDFHTRDGAAACLFHNPDWDATLIHLYSFSKAYRLTGHRVGAIAASPARLAEIEKFLDTVTICVSGPGQMAALWGLENLTDWLAGERLEILRRRAAMIRVSRFWRAGIWWAAAPISAMPATRSTPPRPTSRNACWPRPAC